MPNQPSSYMTEKLSFSNVPQQRGSSASTDARLVNCFIERLVDNGTITMNAVTSRGGLQYQFSSPGGFIQRGIYYFEGSIYTVTNGGLCKDGVVIQALSTLFGPVGFVEFFTSTNQKYLIVLDGTSGWQVTTAGVVTQITSVDFPTPHVPYGVFLDGYLCIAKLGTADIYNSNLDDPMLWTAGDFITAEMYPDNIGALVKQGNYIVAFGQQTVEYFYNAGNFPGTPFQRNDSAYHRVGSNSASSISSFEEKIIFLGNSGVGGKTLYMLDNFKLAEITTDPIRRLIEAEGVNVDSSSGFVVRTKGHAFYVINFVSSRRTFVFDLLQGVWHEWTNAAGTDYFDADFSTDHPDGTSYMLFRITGAVCNMVASKATDDSSAIVSTPITVVMISNKVDFGSLNRKFGNRFTLVCDSTTGASSINLQWSDDDYKTWSMARTMTISDTMTTIQQLGAFRRRAWKLTYNQPYPLRVEGAELTINMGSA